MTKERFYLVSNADTKLVEVRKARKHQKVKNVLSSYVYSTKELAQREADFLNEGRRQINGKKWK